MSDVRIGQVYLYKGLRIEVIGKAKDLPKMLVQVGDLRELLPTEDFKKFKLETPKKK